MQMNERNALHQASGSVFLFWEFFCPLFKRSIHRSHQCSRSMMKVCYDRQIHSIYIILNSWLSAFTVWNLVDWCRNTSPYIKILSSIFVPESFYHSAKPYRPSPRFCFKRPLPSERPRKIYYGSELRSVSLSRTVGTDTELPSPSPAFESRIERHAADSDSTRTRMSAGGLGTRRRPRAKPESRLKRRLRRRPP